MSGRVKTGSLAGALVLVIAMFGVFGLRTAWSFADVGNTGAWGDQANGTYKNAILPGDYQNTDVVQVGVNYYYITSNKSFSPGMLVLHSTDLVSWEPIGHVVDDLTQMSKRYNYTVMDGETRGTWAGSISFRAGTFFVYFTSPDEGIFVSTATNPAGPWSRLTALKSEPGWDDPAPLWDDDGQAYLATTHFSDGYTTYLYRMSADGHQLLDNGTVMMRGEGAEANKLYKINGYYYHFFSKVVSGTRNPYMQRARNIYGTGGSAGRPGTYEVKQILKSSGTDRQPNQGALVQDAAGHWWFVTHQGAAGWEGRAGNLLPVTWRNDWPILGADANGDGIGEMVWTSSNPIIPQPQPRRYPQSSDEFSAATLAPQWEWYFQPRTSSWSLTTRPGYLRMSAFKPLTAGNMKRAGNVLTLRALNTTANTVTVKVDIGSMAAGQRAGLTIFGRTYRWIGVTQDGTTRRFASNDNGVVATGPGVTARTVYLRATWGNNGVARFFYSLDNTVFSQLGGTFQMTNFSNYIGARVGIFSYNDTADTGFVDVDWLRYTYENGPPQ